MTTQVAIIDDRFMLSETFEEHILSACGDRVSVRRMDYDWPDAPLEQGYQGSRIAGILEFQGDPDEVVAHIGGAEVAVISGISGDGLQTLMAILFGVIGRQTESTQPKRAFAP